MLHIGGHKVQQGTYWNVMSGERITIEHEGVLPGSGRYIKASGAVMLLAAPVLGLLFAVFLPFIGIAMTVTLVAKKVAEVAKSAAAQSLSFGWRPVEAYLTGKKHKKAERKEQKNKSGQ